MSSMSLTVLCMSSVLPDKHISFFQFSSCFDFHVIIVYNSLHSPTFSLLNPWVIITFTHIATENNQNKRVYFYKHLLFCFQGWLSITVYLSSPHFFLTPCWTGFHPIAILKPAVIKCTGNLPGLKLDGSSSFLFFLNWQQHSTAEHFLICRAPFPPSPRPTTAHSCLTSLSPFRALLLPVI